MKNLHNGQRVLVLVELIVDDDKPNEPGRVAFTEPEGGYCVLHRDNIIYAFPFDPPQPPEPAFPELQEGDVLIADTGGVAVMLDEGSFKILHGMFPVPFPSGFKEQGKSETEWFLGDSTYMLDSRDRIIVVIHDKEAIWRRP